MPTYISMLRGINVSGQKQIKMEDLRKLYSESGLTNVRSYIQSGNVVFESRQSSAKRLAGIIEDAILKKYGFSVTAMIRTLKELKSVVKGNPFLRKKAIDVSKLHVTFFPCPPKKSATKLLGTLAKGAEQFVIGSKEIYLFCPHGYGRTKLSNNNMEKCLALSATTRNWNSIRNILDLAESQDE